MDKRRSGLTLVELLVAMSILLIGIYAVASGFPALFGLVESERIRTEMSRSVEERLEQIKVAPYQLPEAVAGHGPEGQLFLPDIYPEAVPGEPDVLQANPRDDLTWVLGEIFEAPGAQPGTAVGVYAFKMGPARIADTSIPGDYLQVYELTRLERLDEAPPGGNVPGGYFFLSPDGFLYAPEDYAAAHVDYAWADVDGVLHWVSDEVVGNRNFDAGALPVRAADVMEPEFGNVLPEMTSARGRFGYEVVVPDLSDPEDPDLYPPVTLSERQVAIDPRYGATIALPAADAGRVFHVNYQLKMEPDFLGNMRRVALMTEEFEAPIDRPYQHDLKLRLIEDERPLFGEALDADIPLDPPVYCLLLDLTTGMTWTDADEWVDLDMTTGRLRLNWEHDEAPLTVGAAMGRQLRAYYRTIYEHTIAVQKAPAYFVEDVIAATYFNPDPELDESRNVDYRTYSVRRSVENEAYAELLFPASAVGQMIFVDYLIGEVTGTGVFGIDQRIAGEMHVIRALPENDPHYPEDPGDPAMPEATFPRGIVTLNQPVADLGTGAISVMSVQGASLTVRAWWFDPRGRVQRVGIDTFLTPESLL